MSLGRSIARGIVRRLRPYADPVPRLDAVERKLFEISFKKLC